MNPLLNDAAQRAARYLDTLPTRAVRPDATALARLAELAMPLPVVPQDEAQVLRWLDEIGSPATMATASGRFFGYVVGGTLPVALAADWLTSAWDQNAAHPAGAPGAAAFEACALRWLLSLFGLPADTAGAFVTGATAANLCALAAARHAVLARVGWDVEARGLFGAPPITVIVSEEVHPAVTKSLGLLGLGRERVLRAPVDGQGRVIASRLPDLSRLTGPRIVCLQAGNVNTGAFDPVGEICAQAREAGAWVHVDGAFGLWALASPTLGPAQHGLLQADSWATDAHKWLNVPYDSGLAFVRDAAALRAAMAVSAAYLPQPGPERVPSDFTPELSRRARGVAVWAALAALGRSGVAGLIERSCIQARQLADGLRAAGHEVLNEVVLNQVLVSFGSTAATQRVVQALQAEGTCWCGITEWQGRSAMRISVSSWATRDDDVAHSLAAMLHAAEAAA